MRSNLRWAAPPPRSRIILNADGARHRSPEEDPDRKEEASTALRLAHEILDRAPGVVAAVLDTAWRGTHRARLVARGIAVGTAGEPRRVTRARR
ncbi:hypothetical protein [Streptomyces atratus]|uniref:hypothetical protein n=1 Tax=Streptomyces atratus TaxID=1893 RepID=UPI000B203987|nr:hypothetical protein [Streptomyces atratus]